MSDNIIEIIENTNYSITIDTSLIQNDNNIVIELTNPNNIDVINNTTVLVGDLPQGYPLNWTVGNLPISRLSGLIGTSGINYSSGIISLSGIPTNLLPVQNLLAGSGIDIANNQGIFTVAVTGQFGLTGEQVDDRVSSLLVSGNYTTLNYDDENNKLTISVTGLQPSGNYSLAGHSHVIADVSGLQIILDNKQPSGIYASGVHTHNASDITNFSSAVSGLLPTISGSGYVTSNFSNNSYIIGVSGLQPSGNYSTVGHTHTSSNITDFNSSVSGLLPAINNSGDNRLLTSTGSSFGIDAESNLTFDGNNIAPTLTISGVFPVLDLKGQGSVIYLSDNQNNIIDCGTSNNYPGGVVSITAGDEIYLTLPWLSPAQTLSITSSGLYYNNIPVSISGHSHNSSNITDFNVSVSGLLTRHALLNSPNFSGVPTVPTAISGTNNTQIANTAFVRSEITNLVNSAPSTLDTLNELASALGNDPSFATTVVSGLAQKSNIGHTHTSSEITNFNTSVSGLVSGIYAPLNSPSFSGVPTVPTASSGTNTNQIASTSFVRNEISSLVSSAPSTLDTLNELAIALGNDPNFATTVTNNLASKAALNGAIFTGSVTIPSGTGNFNSLTVNGTGVSLSGHTHTSSNITNFNSSVSGLLPITNVLGGTNISVSSSGSVYTVSVSGQLGLTGEQVDDRVNDLLKAGQYINLNYNDSLDSLTISVTGLQPSGSYANLSHTHPYTDISNFASGVSNSLTTTLLAGSFIELVYNSGLDTLIIGTNGLQPSGNYSVVGHTHTSSDITNFNSSVSGLLPTIANSGDNRILTSTGSTVGINAENNLTFNGSLLNITGSGVFSNNITASGFIRNGGTSSQFLKADGTVDSNSYYLNTNPSGYTNNNGTVTNVTALSIGTSGNDISSTVASGTTTPVITLNIPSASSTNRGVLSSSDWITFNNKQPSGNYSLVGHSHIISDVSGLQNALDSKHPSGNYANAVHNHSISDITNFNSSVSGLLSVKDILGSGYVNVNSSSGAYTISVSGLQPSGNYANTIHNHPSADITDFNSSVSGLLPVTNILGGSNIGISQSGSVYTIAVTGSLGLTTEEVDDRISTLLVAGTGIDLTYNDSLNTLTITSVGSSASGNYALVGHTHLSSNITDFNSSVSGLLPVTNIVGGSNVSVSSSGSIYTIAVTGSLGLTTEEVDDRVSSLLVAGTGISLNYNDSGNTLTISTTKNIILSDVVSSTNYIGIAPIGTLTSSSTWKIKRTIYTSDGAISSTGTALNVAWNDRLTVSYS